MKLLQEQNLRRHRNVLLGLTNLPWMRETLTQRDAHGKEASASQGKSQALQMTRSASSNSPPWLGVNRHNPYPACPKIGKEKRHISLWWPKTRRIWAQLGAADAF